MLAIGDVVEVTVIRVKVYGLFCRHETDEILVLIPYISWIASFCSCEQFAEIGDKFPVKIRNIDQDSGKIAATMIDLYSNPWETEQLEVGRKYKSRVIRFVEKSDRCNDQPAYLIEVLPGAFAMLPANDLLLSPDDNVKVVIKTSDPFMHSVSVAVA